MSRYLGIDLGTTATKAVIIEPDGTVVARARVAHLEARALGAGRVDPQAWINSIVSACRELGPIVATASAIGLSVHCPTALLYDADGDPLVPGVTWDHPRLPALAERAAEQRRDAETALSGNRPSPATMMIAAYTLFRELEPEALERAHEFGLVGSWLGCWLTGQSALDPTQASYTGAFAVDGPMRWMDDFLDRIDVDRGKLPALSSSLSVLGALRPAQAELLGAASGIPVVVGSADTPAASFALGARPSGIPLLIMGTTHVISNCLAAPDSRSLALQRADVRPGQWLINGVTNGGDALATGARMLGYGEVADLIEDAAASDPEQALHAPVFVPHVMPERGPLWLPNRVSALHGFDTRTSHTDAARGIVEGVLFADRMVVESCISASQDELYVSGAFDDESPMPQLIADSLGRSLRTLTESNLSGVGAAAMALESIENVRIPPPPSQLVRPREQWRETIEQRWREYIPVWESTTGRPALSAL